MFPRAPLCQPVQIGQARYLCELPLPADPTVRPTRWVAKPFPSGNEAQNVRDWLKAAWERHLSLMDDRESYRA